MHHQSDQLKCSFSYHSLYKNTVISEGTSMVLQHSQIRTNFSHKMILTRLQKEAPYWHTQLQVLETSILDWARLYDFPQ